MAWKKGRTKFTLGATGKDGKFHLGGWSSNGELGRANADRSPNASQERRAAQAAAAKKAAKTREERYRQIARGIRSGRLPFDTAGGWNG